MMALLADRAAYLLFIAPIVSGVYLMIAQTNLLLSYVGLYLLQTGVVFFYVLLSVREGATLPIIREGVDAPMANPLPHALMLTAIVVGVALLGLATSMLLRIQAEDSAILDESARAARTEEDA